MLGCGALLTFDGHVQQWFSTSWSADDALHLGLVIGEPDGMSTWEFACLFLCLETWTSENAKTGLLIAGDSLVALSAALTYKGKKGLAIIARDISWRRLRYGWKYLCGHLPGEHNVEADILSRIMAPEPAKIPNSCTNECRTSAPRLADLWAATI